jgi:hypothetical protein
VRRIIGCRLFPIYPATAVEADRKEQLLRHVDNIQEVYAGKDIIAGFVNHKESWDIGWRQIKVL